MSSSTTNTDTPPSEQPPPSTASNYLSYPVSHVVSGLYRRLTDSTLSGLPKSKSKSQSPSKRPQPHHSSSEKGSSTLDPVSALNGSSSGSGVYTPPHRTASPFQPPPLTPLTLSGTGDEETILTKAIAEEIRLLVPPRLQLAEHWRLVYSLDRDGVSLGTLYNKCGDPDIQRGTSFVLVVQDAADGVYPPVHHFVYNPRLTVFVADLRRLPDRSPAPSALILRHGRMFPLAGLTPPGLVIGTPTGEPAPAALGPGDGHA